MSNTQPDQPYDILSEEFADFALDEVEEFDTLSDRAEVQVSANRQTFTAKVLGFGSSFKSEAPHSHPPKTRPVSGVTCPACRWADVAILRIDEPSGYTEDRILEPATRTYVLATMGKSLVDGEKPRVKLVFSDDPMEVFRNLFVPNRAGGPNAKKIPVPNAVAFRRSAKVDTKLSTVLEDHEAVVPDPEPEASYQDF
jgi:hypothetical protein